MNRAVDTAAAQKRSVRGVDDCVDSERGDVAANGVQQGGHRLFELRRRWRRAKGRAGYGDRAKVAGGAARFSEAHRESRRCPSSEVARRRPQRQREHETKSERRESEPSSTIDAAL
jgi:hypothetical protein